MHVLYLLQQKTACRNCCADKAFQSEADITGSVTHSGSQCVEYFELDTSGAPVGSVYEK